MGERGEYGAEPDITRLHHRSLEQLVRLGISNHCSLDTALAPDGTLRPDVVRVVQQISQRQRRPTRAKVHGLADRIRMHDERGDGVGDV